ncbi:MAG: anti-sigma-factor antagonist [Ilumatobacteraceae bacterium]|nr:anti-sigma-factor antagonist [Ilumatobacteraceae bacterium]
MTSEASITVDLQHTSDTVQLAVAGELDLGCEELWISRVAEACAVEPQAIVFELSRVTFVDSSGLRLLLVGKNTADRAGIVVRLANVPPPITRLLDMTGLIGEFQTD